ncbi:MAG: M20 family metallopeptidase [Promethearchaeia archaeon]
MVSSKEKIWKQIDKEQEEIVSLAGDLIKYPSENPPGDMSEIGEFVVGYLSNYGLDCETHEPEPGKINIICRLGSGKDKRLVLNGHLDVVPVGDEDDWSFPPFSGEVKDGFLLGRGASDMKGGDAGIISAMRLLIDYEDELDGTVTLTLVPDEETMGTMGTGWILDEKLVDPTACIIAEPTDLPLIDIGQKGAYWGKVVVKGKPIHGSLSPYKGDSAIRKACKVMEKMFDITKVDVRAPSDIKKIIEESKPLIEKLIGEEGVGVVLSSPTLNIGIIKGGSKVNIVPSKCELEFDMRLPIGFDVDEVSSRMDEILEEFDGDAVLDVGTAISPNYTAPDRPLVSLAIKNVEKVLGDEPRVFTQWASSDARHFRNRGIDTIHYGPAIIEGIHGIDEKVQAQDIVQATKVYTGVILDYLA